jgi:catechol 2,3-dioxygenase-like lactoylglutathione lyase family enzyme
VPLDLIGIDHVQIAVARALEAECLAFYRSLIGATEIAKPAELQKSGGAWFQLPHLQLHIGVDPAPSPPSKRHVCFLVPDVEAVRVSLESAGVSIEKFGRVEGLLRFFVRDPAGNRIEIGQR